MKLKPARLGLRPIQTLYCRPFSLLSMWTLSLIMIGGLVSIASAQVPPTPALPTSNFSVQNFQTDLFTGAVSAEIPIVVPPGTAGVTPNIALTTRS